MTATLEALPPIVADMIDQPAVEVASEVIDRAEISGGKALVKFTRTEQALADLAQRYKGAAFDLATTAGDRAARAARLELVTLRTGLEKKRKELKAPALEFGKTIDSEAARITKAIEALEVPIDAQIVADEKRRADEKAERDRLEAERIAGLEKRVDDYMAGVLLRSEGQSSGAIGELIDALEETAVPKAAADVEAYWLSKRGAALFTLKARKLEAVAAELAAREAAIKAREDEAAAEAARIAEAQAEAEQAEANRLALERAEEARMVEAFSAAKGRCGEAAADAVRTQYLGPHIVVPESDWPDYIAALDALQPKPVEPEASGDSAAAQAATLGTADTPEASHLEAAPITPDAQREKTGFMPGTPGAYASNEAEAAEASPSGEQGSGAHAVDSAPGSDHFPHCHVCGEEAFPFCARRDCPPMSKLMAVAQSSLSLSDIDLEERAAAEGFGLVQDSDHGAEVDLGAALSALGAEDITDALAEAEAMLEARAMVEAEKPTLKLGAIGERLGFALPRSFIENTLGVPVRAQAGASCLFFESDFALICDKLTRHVARLTRDALAA